MKLKIKAQLEPVNIDEFNWMYFEPRKRSFLLVHEVRDKKSGEYIQTDTIRIPLSKLEPHLVKG